MKLHISIPKFFFFIVALCAAIMIFTSSFFNVLYDDEFLNAEYQKIASEVTVSEPEVKSRALINYFTNEEDLMYQSEVIFTDKQMTTEELEHMRDVKEIIQGVKRVYFISFTTFFFLLAGFISSIFMKHKKHDVRKERLTLLLIKLQTYVLAITTAIFALLGAFVLFSFDELFTRFHHLFFPQGNWTFPAESLLISLFPKVFFIDFTMAVLGVILRFIILFILLFLIIYGLFMMKVPKDERAEKNREIFGRFLTPFHHKKKVNDDIEIINE